MASGHGTQRFRLVLGAVVVLAVILLAYAGNQARQARDDLEAVAAHLNALTESIKAGDTAQARQRLREAQQVAADAHDHLEGPIWWLTARVPTLRDDVAAVHTVAEVTERLTTVVLPQLVEAGGQLDPANLRPRGGDVELEPLLEAAPALVETRDILRQQADRVTAIDSSRLNGLLAEPVELMQERLREAAALSSRATFAARLLPPMLGAEEERTYLVLFQNNAEIRATGGVPGAFAVLTADEGRLRLREQGSAGDLGRLPPSALTAEERALFGDKMARFAQDLTLTPDFPRTAELASRLWEKSTGTAVDGVVSFDPVALSYLLQNTGSVTLPGGRVLRADNAVSLLLNEVYRDISKPQAQDAFFAAAVRAGFDQLTSSAGDPAQVLSALARGVREGRVYVWSAHEEEQQLLSETTLGGQVPRAPGARPSVGVFLNDGTGAKMQYYLDHRVDVQPLRCNREGRQVLRVRLTLSSRAPAHGAGLPPYVVGMAREVGLSRGSMRLNAHVFAPIGGWIGEASLDGEAQRLRHLEYAEHPVGTISVVLDPGETRVLEATVVTGLYQGGDVDLRVTPGVRSAGVGDVEPSAC